VLLLSGLEKKLKERAICTLSKFEEILGKTPKIHLLFFSSEVEVGQNVRKKKISLNI
jgi:hypothetical protein